MPTMHTYRARISFRNVIGLISSRMLSVVHMSGFTPNKHPLLRRPQEVKERSSLSRLNYYNILFKPVGSR